MEYKLDVFIYGSVIRPSYDGTVKVFAPRDTEYPDFQWLAFKKLQLTSFPEISYSDVRVDNIQIIGGRK
jgi:hypothetical protein